MASEYVPYYRALYASCFDNDPPLDTLSTDVWHSDITRYSSMEEFITQKPPDNSENQAVFEELIENEWPDPPVKGVELSAYDKLKYFFSVESKDLFLTEEEASDASHPRLLLQKHVTEQRKYRLSMAKKKIGWSI